VYGFIDRLQQALPGKLRLDSIVVERLPKDSLAAANVRMEVAFEWLANESRKRESP